MANIRVIQSPYIGPFSNIEAVNESSTTSGIGIHVGELGGRVELTQTGAGTKEYQKVQLDSGATAAADVAPAIGQLVYWKNKSQYLVTNSKLQALGHNSSTAGGQSYNQTTDAYRNEVAGVLTVAATPGNYTWIQQKGNNTNVLITSGSPLPGDNLIATTTSGTGVLSAAAATAPVVPILGKFTTPQTSVTAGFVDLDIPGIP